MIRWDPAKSEKLKRERGVSFEEVLLGEFVRFVAHPRLPHQGFALFRLRGYVWVVPFVREGGGYFLKTAYPSRRYTRMFGKENSL